MQRAFVMSWYDKFGEDAQTVAEAINIATLENRQYLNSSGEASDFSASMYEIAGRGGQIVANILGSWLSRNKGRIIDEYKIERGKLRSGRQTWNVVRVDGGGGGPGGPDIIRREKIHTQDVIIIDTKKTPHQGPPGPPDYDENTFEFEEDFIF